jgi:hypothetical protein
MSVPLLVARNVRAEFVTPLHLVASAVLPAPGRAESLHARYQALSGELILQRFVPRPAMED